ncbi:MAG: GDP-mannose 4,6-dehydratase [Candidatus Aenigmatarchaeota archaeon]|nr:MAG: GDP-mannose 4,6-dehydratase [Candidatus Aenigmarchaeota archaeon]
MTFWTGKNVAVTGGAGFIGSWLCKGLADAGANVFAMDLHDRGLKIHGLANVQYLNCDIRDAHAMQQALGYHEIEYVFHLGAQAIVTVANRAPALTLDTNIRGTCNVLEAARTLGTIKGIVIASSDKAYGEHETLPYSEEAPLIGRHPYDVSKSCTDLLAQAYHKTYKLPVAITRNGNVYGGGDVNWSRIIPGTIRSVLQGERPIIRSDGSPTRDYVYVKDIVNAYMLVGENISKTAGHAFNFGYNDPKSVLQIANLLLKAADSALEPVVQGNAPNEIQNQYLSSEKARSVLGWKPQYGLDAGLKETIAWYRDYFGKTTRQV